MFPLLKPWEAVSSSSCSSFLPDPHPFWALCLCRQDVWVQIFIYEYCSEYAHLFLYFLDLVRIFFLEAQMVKNFPALQETQVWSLGQEDPLEEEMASHSSILAWKIPWTEEPGRLQFMGSQRIGHNWVTNTFFFLSNFRWNKSDREREILYVITYMWTLKSKTKEYNNSKILSIENKQEFTSVEREVGRGKR